MKLEGSTIRREAPGVQGKAILITGASRGLGAALAEAFARRRARLVLVARGATLLDEVARRVAALGGEAHALAADVSNKHAVHEIAGQAAQLVGPIDVLVHNASALGATTAIRREATGTVSPMPLLFDTTCEEFGAVLETNLLGPFRLTKAIAGSMALRGRGEIVLVSSDAAVNAYPGWGAYGVSKAALDHLGRIWAAELEGTGVRVLSVDPGDMDTEMHALAMPEADRSTLARPEDVAERLARLLERDEPLPNGSRIALAERLEAA